MYVESYQWQIGLERILILPLAPCGFDTPYLSLPPLEIATIIPCTWGLSPVGLQVGLVGVASPGGAIAIALAAGLAGGGAAGGCVLCRAFGLVPTSDAE